MMNGGEEAGSAVAGAGVTVRVELGPRSYDIQIVSGSLSLSLSPSTGTGDDGLGLFARAALDASWSGRSCRRGLIVTDTNVRPFAPAVAAALAAVGIETTEAVVPAGEATKNLDHAADLLDRLVEIGADRHTVVVALGGGVVGDLAGFVASTYARGVPLLMVPTSLLAQVDSSVGGKVGVNLPRAKNMVGAFHQPSGVWIDTETLRTLPARELRCGLAEVVKYGVILDAPFFDWIEAHADDLLALEPEAIAHAVATSCRLKAHVVTRDEREETGLRAVLNFGHTIGHAIEAVAGYGGAYQHGEAVAAGMVLESRLAERLGWVAPAVTRRLEALLLRLGLPIDAAALGPDALLQAMKRDKKNRDGRVRFVLPRAIGQVELTDAPTIDDLRAILANGGGGATS
jgi:3-dehydroquinate synthase